MKRRLSLLTILVLCAGIAWGQDDAAARIAERLKVPLATLPVLKDAPALDTVPDFRSWAGPLAFQNLTGFGHKPPVESRGYLATDGKNVYKERIRLVHCDTLDCEPILHRLPDGSILSGRQRRPGMGAVYGKRPGRDREVEEHNMMKGVA